MRRKGEIRLNFEGPKEAVQTNGIGHYGPGNKGDLLQGSTGEAQIFRGEQRVAQLSFPQSRVRNYGHRSKHSDRGCRRGRKKILQARIDVEHEGAFNQETLQMYPEGLYLPGGGTDSAAIKGNAH